MQEIRLLAFYLEQHSMYEAYWYDKNYLILLSWTYKLFSIFLIIIKGMMTIYMVKSLKIHKIIL